jgi:predicted HicB family RNase H-like nuclease
MINVMTIDGQKAIIAFDPEIEMFRGEFIGLSGGADFYAKDVEQLRKEGSVSLRVYLEDCKEAGYEPFRKFSGKFNVRLDPELHEKAVVAAAAHGVSLNDWVAGRLREAE